MPFLSHPKEVAKVIEAAATASTRSRDSVEHGDAVERRHSLQFREEIVMSVSTAAMTSSTKSHRLVDQRVQHAAFWEHLWRTSGLQFVGFFIITSVIYGYQPQVGASPDALVAFYSGDRTRILIAAAFSGLNLLNLLWFAAALRTTPVRSGARRLGCGGDRFQHRVRSAVHPADLRGSSPRVLDRRLRKSHAHIRY